MIREATQWSVVAYFDNLDQASMAARMIVQMNPRVYELQALTTNGTPVWSENGHDYSASGARLEI